MVGRLMGRPDSLVLLKRLRRGLLLIAVLLNGCLLVLLSLLLLLLLNGDGCCGGRRLLCLLHLLHMVIPTVPLSVRAQLRTVRGRPPLPKVLGRVHLKDGPLYEDRLLYIRRHLVPRGGA